MSPRHSPFFGGTFPTGGAEATQCVSGAAQAAAPPSFAAHLPWHRRGSFPLGTRTVLKWRLWVLAPGVGLQTFPRAAVCPWAGSAMPASVTFSLRLFFLLPTPPFPPPSSALTLISCICFHRVSFRVQFDLCDVSPSHPLYLFQELVQSL